VPSLGIFERLPDKDFFNSLLRIKLEPVSTLMMNSNPPGTDPPE
jgi:hypothetical protein